MPGVVRVVGVSIDDGPRHEDYACCQLEWSIGGSTGTRLMDILLGATGVDIPVWTEEGDPGTRLSMRLVLEFGNDAQQMESAFALTLPFGGELTLEGDGRLRSRITVAWISTDGPDLLFAEAARLHSCGLDPARAAALFRAASDGGHMRALYHYAECLRYGTGVDRYAAEAVRRYRDVIDRGSPWGEGGLASCLLAGEGVDADAAAGAALALHSAEMGCARGMRAYGWALQHGVGVGRDLQLAGVWLRRAVRAGDSGALVNIALGFLNGEGETKDEGAAVRLLRRSVAVGNPCGMVLLGECLRDGRGVPQSRAKAAKWFEQAARMGNADGVRMLRDLRDEL